LLPTAYYEVLTSTNQRKQKVMMVLIKMGMMQQILFLDQIVQQLQVLPMLLKKLMKKFVHSLWFHLLG
jgi:Na+-transporting NADH:ubiquinone oxidoreductase subunit NqrE